ncbi:MAG: hypothetical protein NHF85_00805, partial [Candidatus Shikimatogenerans sp. JK-2022]|nr:hypothetical protein [Candidatus Shikimatogenerans bostrichidophilus]
MVYILNIYEKKTYIYSNITKNGKTFIIIKKNNNSLHYNILKQIKKYNLLFLNKLNSICINFGPAISYTRIRNIFSAVKGLSLTLKIPIIKINLFEILLFYYKKKIKTYKKIIFIIIILKGNKKKIIYKNT